MSIPDKIIPHYTYEDWLHWEGKWELIEGHPIAMSPTPVPSHQRTVAELITEFTLALRKSHCSICRVYDAMDYKIADDIILVPDILIVCGEIKKKYLDFPPALVVEILSPASALRDRHTKYQYYQQHGIPYYLIVDVEKQKIEINKLNGNEYLLQEETPGFEFQLEKDCSIIPDLSAVFN